MKNIDLIKMLSNFGDDYEIHIDGSTQFVIEEAGDSDNRVLNFIKN